MSGGRSDGTPRLRVASIVGGRNDKLLLALPQQV